MDRWLHVAPVEAFAATYKIPRGFTSLGDAIAWGAFDAAANVTPDSAHHPTTLALIRAGKHVFCEKPLAENHAKALEMTEAAERAGLVNMVNLTYRNVAALQKARTMVMAGEIGEVRHVDASYLQSWLVSKLWGDWQTESKWLWRLSTAHGSNGALGDIGIHIVDFAAYGAGQDLDRVFCRLKTFDKVLVRDGGEYEWLPALFVRDRGEGANYRYKVLSLRSGKPAEFACCIPYEGNENIIFTDYDIENLPF